MRNKLEFFKNVIEDVNSPLSVNEAEEQMYKNIINNLTGWHIRILDLVNKPEEWFQKYGKNFSKGYISDSSSMIEAAYPELKGKYTFYSQIFLDLENYGLINTKSRSYDTGKSIWKDGVTTRFGKGFLEYVLSYRELS